MIHRPQSAGSSPSVPPSSTGAVDRGRDGKEDSSGPEAISIAGGIVAHNDDQLIARSIESLLRQSLPDGVRWSTIWVVCSGCTDRTVEIAEGFARTDSRIRVIIEVDRRGKAGALNQILRVAEGAQLVLLNADAVAADGSVGALLDRARESAPPYAVMGRPTLPEEGPGPLSRMLEFQWRLHHELHWETLGRGDGNHLSDELLLVSRPGILTIPEQTINDGSYIGAWMSAHGGAMLYAPDARVLIDVPRRFRDHLTQRRRIRVGHADVARFAGIAPTTFPAFALHHPGRALRVLRRTMAGRAGSLRDFALLVSAEFSAGLLSAWDRVPPRRDHRRWKRIPRSVPVPEQ